MSVKQPMSVAQIVEDYLNPVYGFLCDCNVLLDILNNYYFIYTENGVLNDTHIQDRHLHNYGEIIAIINAIKIQMVEAKKEIEMVQAYPVDSIREGWGKESTTNAQL